MALKIEKRPARAGEYILALDDGKSFPGDTCYPATRYKAGDVLRVVSVPYEPRDAWFGRGVCYKHPDSIFYIIENDQYVVLTGYEGRGQSENTNETTDAPLTMVELRQMDGKPVWFQLATGKWVCYLVVARDGDPQALGFSCIVTGHMESLRRLMDEGFKIYPHPPEEAHP